MAAPHKTSVCTNCLYHFTRENNYCPVCGQKNHELRIPLKHLLEELLESTLHFDSKTFTTLKYLLLKPGFLSGEFNAGRRAAYVPPIRLYILISFAFFFLLNILSGRHDDRSHGPQQQSNLAVTLLDVSTQELRGLPAERLDSLMQARDVAHTKINTYLISQMHKMANGSPGEFSHLLMKNISYMMFLLMPLYGGWIYLFNRKRIGYYIESLVISIHFHSFVFFTFTILLVISIFAGMELFLFLEFLIIPFYMLFMLKRVVKQGWLLTTGKTVVIGLLYLASLSSLLLLTVVMSIVFI